MSYTEIYGFDKDGDGFFYGEIRNSWRGAIAIWGILEERYLPSYRPWFVPEHIPDSEVEQWLTYKPDRISTRPNQEKNINPMQEIWNLFRDSNVSETDKIVLGTTFDSVIVKKADLPKVIDAFENFEGETNLKEQAEVLKQMLNDDNVIAVGWNQTSVNADTWATIGGYDEEAEESIPYNILTMDQPFDLFADLVEDQDKC